MVACRGKNRLVSPTSQSPRRRSRLPSNRPRKWRTDLSDSTIRWRTPFTLWSDHPLCMPSPYIDETLCVQPWPRRGQPWPRRGRVRWAMDDRRANATCRPIAFVIRQRRLCASVPFVREYQSTSSNDPDVIRSMYTLTPTAARFRGILAIRTNVPRASNVRDVVQVPCKCKCSKDAPGYVNNLSAPTVPWAFHCVFKDDDAIHFHFLVKEGPAPVSRSAPPSHELATHPQDGV